MLGSGESGNDARVSTVAVVVAMVLGGNSHSGSSDSGGGIGGHSVAKDNDSGGGSAGCREVDSGCSGER